MLRIYVVLWFAALCWCEDQDLLSVLRRQNGISTFIQRLEALPDLLSQVGDGANGPFTVLVPDDAAFASWASNNQQLANDTEYLEALMSYHFLLEPLASADFQNASFFPHTLLNDTKYANVTDGQVVHLTSDGGNPVAVSGLQAISSITDADILFQGGIIQVINAPLTIPETVSTTVSRLKLTDLLALLNKGGFLDPTAPSVRLTNDAPDLSIFAPNNPQFGAHFTGFDGVSQEEIRRVLNYSIVQRSPAMYSSEFKNGTKERNLAQLDLLFIDTTEGFYVDAARIETSDYLIANGVLQITDQLLNPNATGQGPAIVPGDESSNSGGSKISSAAAVGVGLGVGAVVLGLIIGFAVYVRLRKKRGLPVFGTRRRRYRPGQQRLPEQDTPGIPAPVPRTIGGGDRASLELTDTNRSQFMSLSEAPPPRYGTHELDNKAFPSPPSTAALDNRRRQTRHRQDISVVEVRNADGSVTTTTTSRPRLSRLDEPLPPKPMTPQEIDGTERSRISINITGDQPRRLGFQARY